MDIIAVAVDMELFMSQAIGAQRNNKQASQNESTQTVSHGTSTEDKKMKGTFNKK
jgi:hypothetical protein